MWFAPLLPLLLLWLEQTGGFGLYLHVPFCRRRCYYCDFSIEVVGDRESTIRREAHDYTSLLIQDIEKTVNFRPSSSGIPVETVYFGGGTPSLLPIDCVESIMKTLYNEFGILIHLQFEIKLTCTFHYELQI